MYVVSSGWLHDSARSPSIAKVPGDHGRAGLVLDEPAVGERVHDVRLVRHLQIRIEMRRVPEPEGDRAATLRGLGADRRRRQRRAHQGHASEAKEIATLHVRPPCASHGVRAGSRRGSGATASIQHRACRSTAWPARFRAPPSLHRAVARPLWRPETACREAPAGPSADGNAVDPVAARVEIAGADRELAAAIVEVAGATAGIVTELMAGPGHAHTVTQVAGHVVLIDLDRAADPRSPRPRRRSRGRRCRDRGRRPGSSGPRRARSRFRRRPRCRARRCRARCSPR